MKQKFDREDERIANNHFSIKFTDDSSASREKEIAGKIKIGGFSESFSSLLSYWNMQQYVAQWERSLQNIINASEKEALVTSMHDPETANYVNIWTMYREAECIYLQDHILFLNEIEFDESRVADSVLPREKVDEDGNKISEWQTTVFAVEDFLKSNR